MINYGRLQQVQYPVTRVKPHPGIGLCRLRVRGDKIESVVAICGDQLGQPGRATEFVGKSLRRNEPASECDVEFAGVGFALQFKIDFLWLSPAYRITVAHEHWRDPVNEGCRLVGVAGKMHPTERLKRGLGRRILRGLAVRRCGLFATRKTQSVVDGIISIAARWLKFYSKADEVGW